jgi:hypothetical protein
LRLPCYSANRSQETHRFLDERGEAAFCHSDRSDAQHQVAEESGLERKSPYNRRPDSSTPLRCARNDKKKRRVAPAGNDTYSSPKNGHVFLPGIDLRDQVVIEVKSFVPCHRPAILIAFGSSFSAMTLRESGCDKNESRIETEEGNGSSNSI